MANMVIPDGGKELWLDRMTNGGSFESMRLRLYTNNYTPVDGSVPGDFTAATFTGSGPITLTVASWDFVVVTGHVAQVDTLAVPSWTNSGATTETCYGWWLEGVTSGAVYAAQRFDSARVIGPGATESLNPFRIKLKTFV